MIPAHVLDEIRARVSIVDVAADLGARVSRPRSGKSRCACLVHGGGNPTSMALDDGTGLAYCHACGWGGDALALVRQATGASFADAARDLAVRVGVNLDDGASFRMPAMATGRRSARADIADPTVAPSEPVRALWAEIWAVVADLPPTSAMEAWCESRDVLVTTACQLGCRDFGPVLADLREVVGRAPPEVARAAGVLASTRDADRPVLWHPLRGETWSAGLAVPIWHPECSAPASWRQRLYHPARNGAKVLAMFGGGPRLPLGLRVPVAMSTEVCALDLVRAAVVVEGEPDWLSVAECAGWEAAAIGLTSASQGWLPEWTPYLDRCEAVVALIHDGHNDRVAGSLARAMRDRYGAEVAGRRYRRATLPEEHDANDLHREGRLSGLIAELLREVTQ